MTSKQSSILALLFTVCLVACAPYQVRKSHKFPQRRTQHNIIAILPFDVSMAGGSIPKDIKIADLKAHLYVKGQELQTILYKHFQETGCITRILSIEETNRILSGEGITPDRIARMSKEELCRLVGVDAIVTGRIITKQSQKNMPVASSVALLGATGFLIVGSVRLTDTNFDIRIYDTNEPEPIWRLLAVLKNSDQIPQFVNHKLAPILPYHVSKKERKKT